MINEEKILNDLKQRYREQSKWYNPQKDSVVSIKDAPSLEKDAENGSYMEEEISQIPKKRSLNKKYTTYAFACHYIPLDGHENI